MRSSPARATSIPTRSLRGLLHDVDRLARRYPVFRLEPAGAAGQGEREDAPQ